MDTRRLVLRASLQKLLEETSIPQNVELCIQNMASIYEEVDEVRLVRRNRESTDWTDKSLDLVTLTQLGNFKVSVKSRRKTRTVIFTDADRSLEFLFEEIPRSLIDNFDSGLKRLSESSGEQDRKAIGDALQKSIISEALGGQRVSFDELLLGGKPTSLRDCRLVSMRKVVRRSGLLGLIFPHRGIVLYVSCKDTGKGAG